MIQLYTFSSCTSCRKARDVLTKNGIRFAEKNMSVERLSKDELLHLLSFTTNGTTEITSKRSQDVKKLEDALDDLSLNEWIDTVIDHPGILRRPLLLTDDQLVVGYNKEEYDGIIKKNAGIKGDALTAVACS